jgi:hypothetical protein
MTLRNIGGVARSRSDSSPRSDRFVPEFCIVSLERVCWFVVYLISEICSKLPSVRIKVSPDAQSCGLRLDTPRVGSAHTLTRHTKPHFLFNSVHSAQNLLYVCYISATFLQHCQAQLFQTLLVAPRRKITYHSHISFFLYLFQTIFVTISTRRPRWCLKLYMWSDILGVEPHKGSMWIRIRIQINVQYHTGSIRIRSRIKIKIKI